MNYRETKCIKTGDKDYRNYFHVPNKWNHFFLLRWIWCKFGVFAIYCISFYIYGLNYSFLTQIQSTESTSQEWWSTLNGIHEYTTGNPFFHISQCFVVHGVIGFVFSRVEEFGLNCRLSLIWTHSIYSPQFISLLLPLPSTPFTFISTA